MTLARGANIIVATGMSPGMAGRSGARYASQAGQAVVCSMSQMLPEKPGERNAA
jgi:hypothetical protein